MSNVVWIDEQDNILGEVPIEKAHQEGLWHRASVVYLLNSKGEIVIQERADGAGLDHSCAGHVDPGESYVDTAKRELEEELGVKGVELKEVGDATADEPKPQYKKHLRHRFKIFECIAEPGKLEPTEVVRVFWADPLETWSEMQHDIVRKYCGGFKATLEVFLKTKGLFNI